MTANKQIAFFMNHIALKVKFSDPYFDDLSRWSKVKPLIDLAFYVGLEYCLFRYIFVLLRLTAWLRFNIIQLILRCWSISYIDNQEYRLITNPLYTYKLQFTKHDRYKQNICLFPKFPINHTFPEEHMGNIYERLIRYNFGMYYVVVHVL